MKKYLAFLGSAMFFVVCFSLYLMLESSTLGGNRIGELSESDINHIEGKIKQIEQDLKQNHKYISLIKETVRDIAQGDNKNLDKLKVVLDGGEPGKNAKDVYQTVDQVKNDAGSVVILEQGTKKPVLIHSDMCRLAESAPVQTQIQMQEVYNRIPFDNPDGGAWKQGYPITYQASKWTEERPLKVFVVPHSHNDPGWIKTFDKYFQDQTRHILDNMVDKLELYPKMRFIYAEISFFEYWWNGISEEKKKRVEKLLREKRFEIVTGGWVMTDEADSHYFAILDQLIEGHQWLQNHIGFKPQSGWAIDPFGHSPTMPYLLKGVGLKNMLVQRIHYATKKELSKSKDLEFKWRQNWDHSGSTDMFCHMMPFYSYDIPHTCGPEPAVCCQFDFARLPGSRINCPWRIAPVAITEDNVASRAETLLDQYRKKSELYRNSVVLIPIGDDFRYDKTSEWDQQYLNYQKLFDYMNSRKDWHVEVKFGILSDYFDALKERAGKGIDDLPNGYSTLSGDFSTYADRDDHYWSGYFTSRPFYKRLDRVLEYNLRAAEILYSVASAYARHHQVSALPTDHMMTMLVGARRSLGLFQHHDAITGTAKDFVVADYGRRMLSAVMDSKRVISESAHFLSLANKKSYSYSENVPFFDLDESRQSHDALPEKNVITLSNQKRPVLFYNSLGFPRKEIVRLYVSDLNVEVSDSQGNVIASQVDPFWLNNEDMATNIYKLVFVAHVPAVGLSRYHIRQVNEGENKHNSFASITMYKSGGSGVDRHPFHVTKKEHEDFTIENAELKISVSGETGSIKTITEKATGQTLKSEVEFVKYGVKISKERSGAYLFLPDGQAQRVTYSKPFIRLIRGSLLTEVQAFISHVEHIFRLHNSPGIDSLSIDMLNIVDIRGEVNYELAMRFKTDVQNTDKNIYTDMNGFQIQRRQTFDKLPLQASYFPMTSMVYIQDKDMRFSVLSGQSLGVAGLQTGWVEIMMDRRLNQDDNRGLGQGVLDNKRTPNRFRVLVEKRSPQKKVPPVQNNGFPSLVSQLASQQFIHRLMVLSRSSQQSTPVDLLPSFSLFKQDLPCEMHLLNLRTLQNKQEVAALLLHRLAFDCSFPSRGPECKANNGKWNLQESLADLSVKQLIPTSFSLLHDKASEASTSDIQVQPMEIAAYKVELS